MTPPQDLDDAWRDQAACRNADPEMFFPEKTNQPPDQRRKTA